MKVLNTKEVCELLGVSRSWVNSHLRKIGFKNLDLTSDKANIKTIYYKTDDIVNWFNKNALFSRQTMYIDLADHMPKTILSLSTFDIPSNIHNATIRVNERMRGECSWVTVDYKISSIEDLKSLSELQNIYGFNNSEMTYRYIFSSGMIKAEICGRKWYIEAPEKKLYHPVLVPADENF